MDIRKYIEKYKSDLLPIALLMGVFAFLSVTFWGKQTNMLIDCGREFYVPMEMLKGQVLYKDIINIYGPLSYQINALFYLLLGQHINTLYIAGTLNALIIIGAVYLISRVMTSPWVSFTSAFMIITLCAYNYYIFNYISPYSYAAAYGLSSFLLSVLFVMLYFKNSRPVYVPVSFFFISLALLFKYEYAVYLVLLGLFIFFLKPISKRYSLYSFISFIAMPIISWGTLFIQGLTISDCVKSIVIIKKITSASTLKYFYTNLVGVFYNNKTMVSNLKVFVITMTFFIIAVAVSYLVLKLLAILSEQNEKLSKYALPMQILGLILILFFMPRQLIIFISQDISLSWMPIITTFILLGFMFSIIKQCKLSGSLGSRAYYQNIRSVVSNLDVKDKLFIILTIIALSAALKTYFFLNLHLYGTFMLPLLLVVNLVFLIDYLPKYWKLLDKEVWHRSCLVILVLTGTYFSIQYKNLVSEIITYPVTTERGTVYTVPKYGNVFDSTIKYINKNVPSKASFLMIPESPMLNFLTNRESDNKYLSLIPLYVEVFGEENIINDLTKNPPDFIFLNNRETGDYGFPYFCRDYGNKICEFIQKNYAIEEEFNDDLQMIAARKNRK